MPSKSEPAAINRVEIHAGRPATSQTSTSANANAPIPMGRDIEPLYQLQGRDLRIDLIRGLIMLSVISVHAFMLSAISFVFWERVGIVSSGEGFVLLSGIVLGVVHSRTLVRRGIGEVCEKVLKRAAQLYRTYLGVSFAILLLRVVPGAETTELTTFANRATGQVYPLFPPIDAPWLQVIGKVFRLQAGPHQYQVIGLYVVLMAFAPLVLWAIHKEQTRLVLGVSWALYLSNMASPTHLSWGAFEYAFPSYVWQVLFVHGLALGVHWQTFNAWLFGRTGRWARIVMTVLALGFALFSWNHPQPNLAPWAQLHWIKPELFYSLYGTYFQKTTLGIGRLLNVGCVFVALLWFVTHWWGPLARTVGRFLIPIGQATLYVFIVHVFMIFVLNQFAWARSPSFYLATMIHTAMIGTVFLMVRYKVFFSIIPR